MQGNQLPLQLPTCAARSPRSEKRTTVVVYRGMMEGYSRMFLAASLEKVSASIREGSMFSFSTMYAILAVMVVVLPVPLRLRGSVEDPGCVLWLRADGILRLRRSNLM